MVYAKPGNIWVQQDKDVRQVTDGGGDSMPSFSADGQWIVFIRSHDDRGYWPVRGRTGRYDISVPEIMRVKTDGSAKPERLASGLVRRGQLKWACVDAPAGALARRQDDRARDRRARPGQLERRAAVLRHRPRSA